MNFLSVSDGKLIVELDGADEDYELNIEDLKGGRLDEIFVEHDVHEVMNSSSVDFPEEYGLNPEEHLHEPEFRHIGSLRDFTSEALAAAAGAREQEEVSSG